MLTPFGGRYLIRHPLKLLAVFLLDLLGAFIFLPLKMIQRDTQPPANGKILAVRFDQIGDVIMALPAIEKLKAKYPGARIDVLTSKEMKPVLEEMKICHKVIAFESHWFSRESSLADQILEVQRICKTIKSERYDTAIDFRGDFRTLLLLFMAKVPVRLGYPHAGGGFLLSRVEIADASKHQVYQNLDLVDANI